jgi:hypothetical protein
VDFADRYGSVARGRSKSCEAERGVGLVEIVLALTILSVGLLALGGLMYQISRETRWSMAVAYRSAAAQSAASWAEALPWDSLHVPPGGPVGCMTDTTGQLIYNRCTALTNVSTKHRRLSIAITPIGRLTAPPDTVVIDRNKPSQVSPFR